MQQLAQGKTRKYQNTNFLPLSPFAVTIAVLGLSGCLSSSSLGQANAPPHNLAVATQSPSPVAIPTTEINLEDLLQESWNAYRQRFIQADGRVIDREDSDRSTSEAQAYAMLRAVFADDPTTFARTLNWSENNLQRTVAGSTDQLWAWEWGRDIQGNWEIRDRNFASDADIDAITALIFASRRWQRPEYLQLAQSKLEDLWNLSTVAIPDGRRYLIPGPREAFQVRSHILILNPSYFAPYAFRIFAQVDPTRDWQSLVDSSYQVLENSAKLSKVNLPSDWVSLDTQTGNYQALPASHSLRTEYSFNAYRVWWRLAWDAVWFQEPQATQFLRHHLKHLQQMWSSTKRIPAQIDLQGNPLVNYEATSQYAMLFAAFRLIEPAIATQILQQKLLPQYRSGIWEQDSAYYTQNLVGLGLFPPTELTQLLHPTN
ncbi:glycosyl hydrolase family 8 [Gloeocapsopsis dulcis]|uniref:Glycosyl hydrolase n=1 Tax=Gloeocapsopsis dulcis AAB1 = 1H9 TaxID=1433147 RepID=A0A6N8FS46_9CHRO|nr:glycosyl hydrolase family 8 [Gloeocapsopsis dulcis]MUL35771.1 glycosyl hydrolase [Gloeocapsopsis dulcis AAB1 = 1H9]WNN90945.1 glycosyl hydrolase family 8 [Gloeocapsopsis dulcis]